MKQVIYSKAALQTLEKIPRNIAERIRSKVAQYAEDPSSLVNNVSALQGEPGYFRLRVGDWRVIFTEEGRIVDIVRIAPRGSAYG